ncbi:short chain dehydrogenase/reductase family protein [Coccidioides immitis H538.4]|uniref:Short chain dehydrogenase/reductase family protein n=1 Tax=Coccidioides immitis H538.4 TaxID=396776 RepID=A0A0J8RWA2_COCIT|nr:short chain dehydrogenase/reductase family protein [Coccidioides immitis H538.4]
MDSSTKAIETPELFSIKGLVAVISGGGSGIGRMITRALAVNGAAKVYILGRRGAVLEETAKPFPDVVIPIECDVTSKESLQAAVDKVTKEVGYINVLWCNSGTSGPESPELTSSSSLDQFIEANWRHSVEEYAETFKVNTAGFWYTAIAFLKLLHLGNERGNGMHRSQIIGTCSTLGFGRFAATGRFAYGQSKASQTHMMKQLSTHLVPYGIRVNMVAPGHMTSSMTASGYDPSKLIPEGRAGADTDMAGIVLFLAITLRDVDLFRLPKISLDDAKEPSLHLTSPCQHGLKPAFAHPSRMSADIGKSR